MTPTDIFTFANPAASITSKLISGALTVALAGVVVVGGYWLIIGGPAHDRLVAAQAQATTVVSKGDTLAAQDAAGVVASQSTKDAAVDATTRTNDAQISAAPGATVRLDPKLDLAGRLSLCRRKAYSSSPACVALLKANP